MMETAVDPADFNAQVEHYTDCPPLREYLAAWRRGDSLQPATFTLELAG
jgi:hypothetical protein